MIRGKDHILTQNITGGFNYLTHWIDPKAGYWFISGIKKHLCFLKEFFFIRIFMVFIVINGLYFLYK